MPLTARTAPRLRQTSHAGPFLQSCNTLHAFSLFRIKEIAATKTAWLFSNLLSCHHAPHRQCPDGLVVLPEGLQGHLQKDQT